MVWYIGSLANKDGRLHANMTAWYDVQLVYKDRSKRIKKHSQVQQCPDSVLG